MKLKILALLACILAGPCFAQEAPVTENPNVYGRWEFHASNGMEGVVIIDENYCNFSYTSSFASSSVPCFAVWGDVSNKLAIIPNPQFQGVFTVPDYQDSGEVLTFAETGSVNVGMDITRFGRDFMTGHLVGAGKHTSVRLTRH